MNKRDTESDKFDSAYYGIKSIEQSYTYETAPSLLICAYYPNFTAYVSITKLFEQN